VNLGIYFIKAWKSYIPISACGWPDAQSGLVQQDREDIQTILLERLR
jgi:hypothetical protein